MTIKFNIYVGGGNVGDFVMKNVHKYDIDQDTNTLDLMDEEDSFIGQIMLRNVISWIAGDDDAK